nr:hypothetical protein [uncultured Carboxylicivirga sp.]
MTKVLKQNGVGGKIIRAQSSGKVLKQNYSFGKSLTNIFSFDLYLTLKHNFETFEEEGTIELFCKDVDDSSQRYFFQAAYDGSNNLHSKVSTSNLGEVYLCWRWDASGVTNNSYAASYRGNISGKSVTYFTLSGGDDGARKDQYFYIGSNRNKLFRYYGRKISTTEMSYNKNNNLGNEPLNTKSLLCEIDFKFAEIIDFNGTVGVGFRDKSGNGNHAKFVGLPSGTLQEQVDYVNNSLLKL